MCTSTEERRVPERSFFMRDPVVVAGELVGCLLVRRMAEGRIVVRITETEAYGGADDPASHAHRGPTSRNKAMFGEPGRLYVYLIYGLHHCLNIVAHEEGAAGAVLIRAGEPVEGIGLLRRNRPGVKDAALLNGPGKLAAALSIDRSLNGFDPIAPPIHPAPVAVIGCEAGPALERTPRIGISAGKELPWRFIVKRP